MGSGKAFLLALNKYGKENFQRKILQFASSPEELNKLEIYYIRKFNCNSSPDYYNLVEGGGTVTGLKFKPETIQRFRALASGENNYFYGKRFYGEDNPFYGKYHTKESREIMSKSHIGKLPWNKGKIGIYSKETLETMRMAKSGKSLSKRHREAIRKNALRGENHPFYGKHFSEETKRKIGEANRGKRRSPDQREKMSEATIRRHKERPESFNRKIRKVRCINTGKVFESAEEARKWVGLANATTIRAVCAGTKKTSGKLNGEKLRWEYIY